MLPVASLLNPIEAEIEVQRPPSSPCSTYYTLSSAYSSPAPSHRALPMKQKIAKDRAVFAKGRIRGPVNYAPFEQLDEASREEAGKFQVYPLGRIQDYCRHIPYNSDKKDFYQKTQRESFEVFQYTFKVPRDEKEYAVMWDYNIGLVRITPFFKCCKYSKTTPAKMLNLNPGLKDITHSITGGALAAQGYWMPYNSARAVCATFCYNISGALIPLFGPEFPSQCIRPDRRDFGHMAIDQAIVLRDRKVAEDYRLQAMSTKSHTPRQGRDLDISSRVLKSTSASPQLDSLGIKRCSPDHYRLYPQTNVNGNWNSRMRLKRAFSNRLLESPHNTDTEGDGGSETSSISNDRYLYSPLSPSSTTSSGWTIANMPRSGDAEASDRVRSLRSSCPHRLLERVPPISLLPLPVNSHPWLSALPSSTRSRPNTSTPRSVVMDHCPRKRRMVSSILPPMRTQDNAMPPLVSPSPSLSREQSRETSPERDERVLSAPQLRTTPPSVASTTRTTLIDARHTPGQRAEVTPAGVEKDAALLLMNLSGGVASQASRLNQSVSPKGDCRRGVSSLSTTGVRRRRKSI